MKWDGMEWDKNVRDPANNLPKSILASSSSNSALHPCDFQAELVKRLAQQTVSAKQWNGMEWMTAADDNGELADGGELGEVHGEAFTKACRRMRRKRPASIID